MGDPDVPMLMIIGAGDEQAMALGVFLCFGIFVYGESLTYHALKLLSYKFRKQTDDANLDTFSAASRLVLLCADVSFWGCCFFTGNLYFFYVTINRLSYYSLQYLNLTSYLHGSITPKNLDTNKNGQPSFTFPFLFNNSWPPS